MHQRSWSSKISMRWFLLSIGTALFLSMINCPSRAPISHNLIAPNWQDGEVLYYNIVRDSNIIGKVRYSLFFDMNAGLPVYVLHLVTKMEPTVQYFFDSSVVCFQRSDFSPVWAWQKVESEMGYSMMTTRYVKNTAEIWKETIDGTESIRLRFNEPCYDNEMVLTVLRALRFKTKKKYNFSAVVSLSGQVINNSVRKMAKSTITTSAGAFECNKIQLRYQDKIYYIFYEQNEPHRLIRYQEKDSNTMLELTAN